MTIKPLDDARALWAVRVLDEHARNRGRGYGHETMPVAGDGQSWVRLVDPYSLDEGDWLGADEDAARLAAAEAVFPTLDRNALNWPGDKP